MVDYDTNVIGCTTPAEPEVQAILDAWHDAWTAWGDRRVHASEPLPRPETESSGSK